MDVSRFCKEKTDEVGVSSLSKQINEVGVNQLSKKKNKLNAGQKIKIKSCKLTVRNEKKKTVEKKFRICL